MWVSPHVAIDDALFFLNELSRCLRSHNQQVVKAKQDREEKQEENRVKNDSHAKGVVLESSCKGGFEIVIICCRGVFGIFFFFRLELVMKD